MSDAITPDEGEHLATGWEPDLPADDSIVRQAAHLHASWPVALAAALGRPFRATDGWAGAFLAERGDFSNSVVVLQPPTDVAALVAEIDALVPSSSPYWVACPWQSADFAPHGLTLLGYPPLMVRFPAAHAVSPRDGVEVVEVREAHELAVAERVLVEGYPFPDAHPLTPGDVLHPAMLSSDTRVWLGYVDGEPAAVAAAHSHQGVTLVEYVAALPVARGRGAGSAVTWAATLSRPDQPAMLIASDDGRPVYAGMGYVAIERWAAWLRPAVPA